MLAAIARAYGFGSQPAFPKGPAIAENGKT
jgi:hypothetical protein